MNRPLETGEMLNDALARHGLGVARIAVDGPVLFAEGAVAQWLTEGANAFETPVLAGMEQEFARLRAGVLQRLALPALALNSGARFGVSVVWRDDAGCFELLAAPADSATEIEATLARERRARAFAEERASLERARADAEARSALVMRERLKIAHDLHDTIVQALVAVVAQLGLVRKVAARAPERATEEIARADQAAREGLAMARDALGQVRFERAGADGLGAALRRAAERWSARAGLPAEAAVAPEIARLAGERAEIIYRIVEEALRNIQSHAEAATVRIHARVENGEAIVEVVDDGKGFDPAAPRAGHYGLAGMREQAGMIGGRLVVESAPGKGARVVVRAPFAEGRTGA